MIHITAFSTRRSRSIRILPLSALLISVCLLSGCDSQSANSSVRAQVSKSADVEAVAQSQHEALAFSEQTSSEAASEADEIAGRPLLASAQSDESEPLPNEYQVDNADSNYSLGATLIGDYGGTVPCRNCERVDVTLNLFSDGSVAKTSVYQTEDDKPQSVTQSGIYRQDEHVITIVYDDQDLESYNIDGNYLVQLNANDLPNDDYTLSRM